MSVVYFFLLTEFVMQFRNHFQVFSLFAKVKLIIDLSSFDFIQTISFAQLTIIILIAFNKSYRNLAYKSENIFHFHFLYPLFYHLTII